MSDAPAPTRARSIRLDAMRGFAMACVVLGHAAQRNLGPHSRLLLVLAAFEMPLFALVSGYLTKPHLDRVVPWIGQRAQRLLVPFVAWAPVLWFMSRYRFTGLAVVGIPHSLLLYLQRLFPHPEDGLWYLVVLFELGLLAVVFWLLSRRVHWAVALGACWLLVELAVPLFARYGHSLPGDFGLTSLHQLTPYFLAGLALRQLGVDLGGRLDARVAAVVAVLFLGTAYVTLWDSGPQHLAPSLNTALAILGVTGAVLVIGAWPWAQSLRPLAFVGQASLGVYAIHLMFLRTGIGHGAAMALTSFAIALTVALLGTVLLRRNPWTAAIFLGESAALGKAKRAEPESDALETS